MHSRRELPELLARGEQTAESKREGEAKRQHSRRREEGGDLPLT